MRTTLHVLSVGSSLESDRVRDALLERQKCHLIAATGTLELNAVSADEQIDVALLHASGEKSILRHCAGMIRRQWPYARILLLSTKPEALDDQLYEECVSPHSSSEELLAAIEMLAAVSRRARQLSPAWIETKLIHTKNRLSTLRADVKEVRTQS
jgi:hypothetical protein